MKKILILAFIFALAACGGGGGGSNGVPPTNPPQGTPSGTILFGRPNYAPFTTTQTSPTTWSVSASSEDGPYTADESGYLGEFAVTTSGPCLSASPASFPTGGAFLLKATGLICIFDGHVETVTVKDSSGNSITEYGRVI